MLDIPFLLSYQLPGLIITIIFLVICECNHKKRKEKVTTLHRVFTLVLGCYLTLLFTMTVSPEYGFSLSRIGQEINLIPFSALREPSLNTMNFMGNVFLFVPLGVLLVFISRQCRKLIYPLISGLIISVLIEVLQLFEGRGTDIDDVILNVLGTLLGYFIGYIIVTGKNEFCKSCGASKVIEGKKRYRKKDYNAFWGLVIPIIFMIYIVGFFHIYKNEGENMKLRFSLRSNTEGQALSEEPIQTEELEGTVECEIEGKNAFVIRRDTGEILYSKNENEKIAPASTTKLLTAYTVLQHCDESERVVAGEEISMALPQATKAGFQYGDELTIRQLLEGLLIPSGADAAYTLAVYTGRKIGGENLSIQDARNIFIEEMNKNAADLGMEQSHFETVDGNDADNQYTTAKNLVTLLYSSLCDDVIRDIVKEPIANIETKNGNEYTLINTNELIDSCSEYYCKECIGVKTGNTSKAGSCLTSAFEKDGKQYLMAVMGDSEAGRFLDSLLIWDRIKKNSSKEH